MIKQNEPQPPGDAIQTRILDEPSRAIGVKGFDRWRNPRFYGEMENAHSSASLTGACGDTMVMFFRAEGERVIDTSYMTTGCSSSSIAGSFAAEMTRGKTFTEILDMSGADILREIGTFPIDEEHCAHLAIRTMQEAVNNYMKKQTASQQK